MVKPSRQQLCQGGAMRLRRCSSSLTDGSMEAGLSTGDWSGEAGAAVLTFEALRRDAVRATGKRAPKDAQSPCQMSQA